MNFKLFKYKWQEGYHGEWLVRNQNLNIGKTYQVLLDLDCDLRLDLGVPTPDPDS